MAKGSIVVSLRSKGLPSFNRALFLDLRYQAVQFVTELLDIFLAAFVSLACLSWSSWISIAVIILSIAGTQSSDFARLEANVIFVFFIYILLPLLLLLVIVFSRRDRASRSLADLKASFVTLVLSRPPGSTPAQREASDDLHRRAVTFIDDLRQYLQHRRPYARHFYLPYRTSEPSPTDELLRVSRELGLLLRKVHRGVRDMHLLCNRMSDTGINQAQVASLVSKVEAVHASTERLINIKEMRTPVVLRATIRWFVVVLIPVVMGGFWNNISKQINDNGAFGGILGVLTQIALMGIVDTVVAMEDPFDDTALDAISLFEVLDQVGVMTTPTTDADGYEELGPEAEAAASGDGGAPHVAMYVGTGVSGGGGSGGGSGGTLQASGTPGAAAAAAAAEAEAASPGSPAGSTVAPLVGSSSPGPTSDVPGMHPQQSPAHHHRHQHMTQPSGIAAMRGSIVTSETAVGPPSAIEPYGTGGNVPSITSPPMPDVGTPVRGPMPAPPMPALAGHSMFRNGAGGPAAVHMYGGL